jgi:hypothetical protein
MNVFGWRNRSAFGCSAVKRAGTNYDAGVYYFIPEGDDPFPVDRGAFTERLTGDRVWHLTDYTVRGYTYEDPGAVYLSKGSTGVYLKDKAVWLRGSFSKHQQFIRSGDLISVWDGQYRVYSFGFIVCPVSGGVSVVFLKPSEAYCRVERPNGDSVSDWVIIKSCGNYPTNLADAQKRAEEHFSALYAAAANFSPAWTALTLHRSAGDADVVYASNVREHAEHLLLRAESAPSWMDGVSDMANRLSLEVLNSYPATDVDMIENMTQLRTFGDTVRTFLSPVDASPRGLAAAASGRLLSAKYGDMLTLQDAASLQLSWWKCLTGAWTEGVQTRRAAASRSDDTLQVKFSLVSYAKRNGDPLTRAMLFAADRGFLPGLDTVWNLVPYSFVVDWFVNIQEICAGSRAQTIRNCLTCLACSYSVRTHDTQKWGSATIEVKTYNRRILSSFPFPYADLHVQSPSLNQLATGAALVTQRLI